MPPKSLKHPQRRSRFSVKTSVNYIERMPPEVILKILCYLDAGSLFCLGFVNKHFQQLANDNALWYRFYAGQQAKEKKRRLIDELTDGLGAADIQEKPEGHWRRLFFKQLTGHSENWRRKLKAIHAYTGLPSQTEHILRSMCVRWTMTVMDKRGRLSTFEQNGVHFSSAAVTVLWNKGEWPCIDHLSEIQLHGVVRVPLKCPNEYKPGWRSLVTKVVLNKDKGTWCGSDRMVKLLYLEQGITVGIWQEQREIAFVLANLHHHQLVERSLLGSSTMQHHPAERVASFDDVDPEYGLHGYTAHFELHNTVESITSARFSQMFCRKDQITDGFVSLRVISKQNRSQFSALCGGVSFPWRTEALQGHIEGCCTLTLTVLDEAGFPFWCVSAPVAVTKSVEMEVLYDCSGDGACLRYEDKEGKVEVQLQWVEDQKQYFIVNLVISLSLGKINKHFGRNY
ncbi:F-box only protein 15 isoform X1 [Hoplias malabaricus]|uniref:F-box only protein 15 isoform X1 n=1 Tax=Hoplias malabaricus TaxID=27720 RepID=UPI003462DFC2